MPGITATRAGCGLFDYGIVSALVCFRIEVSSNFVERAHVEMIEVRVGKKDDVDLGEVANGQRGRGQAFRSECKSRQPDSDPRKQNRIRENLYPKKID
jgi:hypothetical protein